MYCSWLMVYLLVQGDDRFLRELFSQLQDEATPEEKYKELVSCRCGFSCTDSQVYMYV